MASCRKCTAEGTAGAEKRTVLLAMISVPSRLRFLAFSGTPKRDKISNKNEADNLLITKGRAPSLAKNKADKLQKDKVDSRIAW